MCRKLKVFPCLRSFRCGAYLFVRSIHTLIVIGVVTTFVVKETDLSECFRPEHSIGAILYATAFLALVAFSLGAYFTACLVDPGYVTLNRKNAWESEDEEEGAGDSEHSTMLPRPEAEQAANQEEVKLRHCGFCGVQQPLRARHCEDCNRCVRRFDHHCPWLDTCVGERNHRYFYVFLVSTWALIVWAIVIAWRAMVSRVTWSAWFHDNVFFLVILTMLFTSGSTVMCLASFHSYLMINNQTTWECVSRERITYLKNLEEEDNPFHEGYYKNVYRFLCSMGARKWELIYKKYVSHRDSEM